VITGDSSLMGRRFRPRRSWGSWHASVSGPCEHAICVPSLTRFSSLYAPLLHTSPQTLPFSLLLLHTPLKPPPLANSPRRPITTQTAHHDPLRSTRRNSRSAPSERQSEQEEGVSPA
jgi:hypothetical protein